MAGSGSRTRGLRQAPGLLAPIPRLPGSRRGPTARVAQTAVGELMGGVGRGGVGPGPKSSVPRTAPYVLHTWHPGVAICSKLTASWTRGVGMERDKDTAW